MQSPFIALVIRDDGLKDCVIDAFWRSDSGLRIWRTSATEVTRNLAIASGSNMCHLPDLLITSASRIEGRWKRHMAFLRKIKESGLLIPILAINSLPAPNEGYQELSILADRIVAFPFDPPAFISAVQELLETADRAENVHTMVRVKHERV